MYIQSNKMFLHAILCLNICIYRYIYIYRSRIYLSVYINLAHMTRSKCLIIILTIYFLSILIGVYSTLKLYDLHIYPDLPIGFFKVFMNNLMWTWPTRNMINIFVSTCEGFLNDIGIRFYDTCRVFFRISPCGSYSPFNYLIQSFKR